MYSLLLVFIYLAFISLGLPDSLLGSAWPSMYQSFEVPLSYAGIITMIVSGGTILSSLASARLTTHLGTAYVTAGSILCNAIALLGFATAPSFIWLCIWAIPYGLSAGSIDAALNHYVAIHYSARHMSWLHCFWGVGTIISPYLVGVCLTAGQGWKQGYLIIFAIQILIAILFLISLPLWKHCTNHTTQAQIDIGVLSLRETLKTHGAFYAMLSFFTYCSIESIVSLWASGYLVLHRNFSTAAAAKYNALFFLGITMGRFLSGILSTYLQNHTIIRTGFTLMAIGICCLFLPLPICSLFGFIILGFGCAPIYPSLLYATPTHFGQQASQSMIGLQMASAYIGCTFVPAIFGWISELFSIASLPILLLLFLGILIYTTETLHHITIS